MKISKKITKIGWVFLLNLLFLQLFVSAAAVDPTEKLTADSTTGTEAYTAPGLDTYHVDAKAALLVELNTGEILVSQNAEESAYPASLTKIMTCLLTIENGNLDDIVTVSETALADMDPAGSTADLQVGEEISVEDLLYCMMLSSANEACNVAAEYVSGSIDAFVALMNERAAELGCTGTHFANPHGLHEEDHYTTAMDLARITEEALQNKTFYQICTTTDYVVPVTNLSEERTLHTTNYLVSDSMTSDYYYARAAGVKTGFTTPAGRCLITTATDGNLDLLSIVLGADTVVQESGDLVLKNFTETKALCEYAFDTFDYAKVLDKLNPVAQAPVIAAEVDTVVLAPTEDIIRILPKDHDTEQIKTSVTLDDPEGIEAPVEAGQILGAVTVSYQGQTLGTVPLAAISGVERSGFLYYKQLIFDFLGQHWVLLILLVVVLLMAFLLLRYAMINRARRRRRRRRR